MICDQKGHLSFFDLIYFAVAEPRARLVSLLLRILKESNAGDVTIACLMSHTTTEQVQKTYKRHRPKDQSETISYLPTPDLMPYFLQLKE